MTSAVSSSDNGMASQMPSVPQSRGMKRKLGTRKTNPAQECETRSDPDPFEALVVSDRRQIDDKADEAQGEPW